MNRMFQIAAFVTVAAYSPLLKAEPPEKIYSEDQPLAIGVDTWTDDGFFCESAKLAIWLANEYAVSFQHGSEVLHSVSREKDQRCREVHTRVDFVIIDAGDSYFGKDENETLISQTLVTVVFRDGTRGYTFFANSFYKNERSTNPLVDFNLKEVAVGSTATVANERWSCSSRDAAREVFFAFGRGEFEGSLELEKRTQKGECESILRNSITGFIVFKNDVPVIVPLVRKSGIVDRGIQTLIGIVTETGPHYLAVYNPVIDSHEDDVASERGKIEKPKVIDLYRIWKRPTRG